MQKDQENPNYEKYFFEGDKSLLYDDSHKLAVVGSRSILNYTKNILEDLFLEIKNYNFTLISGGMYGVDIFSHNLALENNLKTIIVLPQGIESYKKSSLYSQLKLKNNDGRYLFISKYLGDELPRKHTFLERNRVISNLSSSVLVAQAGIKSGSFSTGLFSIKNSKKVFCPPFSLDDFQFQGTNLLLKIGASLYLKPNDLLEFYEIDIEGIENRIIDLLKNQPKSMFTISELLGVELGLIEKSLLKLILRGRILFDGENYYL